MPDEVSVVSSDALRAGPPTPGMARQEAFAADDVWFGEVTTDPGMVSGWHHHGEHRTYGRIVAGGVRFEFGAGGNQTVEAGPGDYFMVPPHAVHRESNLSADEESLVLLVRVGTGPTVVNVDGPVSG